MATKLAEIFQRADGGCSLCRVLETVLNEIPEPIVLVDEEGYIIFLNRAYLHFLKISLEEAVGKKVTEIIDNTRLHIICLDRRTEINHLQTIKGNKALVHRIPIFLDGDFLGALGKVNFRDVEEIENLLRHIDFLSSKVDTYRQSLKSEANYTFHDIVGASPKIRAAKQVAEKLARTNSTVLLLGETGVGKELFAHAIHNASERRHGPFISINCAAIPQDLLESELFGYAEGAFTGAHRKGKLGKFELAEGGTVFLDEVGDMSLRMQSKLLRVLQDKQIERVGSTTKGKFIDVRVIAATNQNLEIMVRKKIFRADLFYRLNTLNLTVPPLRERLEDIPLILEFTLRQLNLTEHIAKSFSIKALDLMAMYSWPGNVRELINVVERLVLMEDSPVIEPVHVKAALNWLMAGEEDPRDNMVNALEQSVSNAEKEAIYKALAISRGNKARAAKLLGIHRTTLYQKLQRYAR